MGRAVAWKGGERRRACYFTRAHSPLPRIFLSCNSRFDRSWQAGRAGQGRAGQPCRLSSRNLEPADHHLGERPPARVPGRGDFNS